RGGSVGVSSPAATGVSPGAPKLDPAAGALCRSDYTLSWYQASANDRAVTANCDIAAQADQNIYLTELTGPANVLLARTASGDVRITTTETAVEGNDIVLLHSGSTLVVENAPQSVPNGLIEAGAGNVLLLSADDVVTDPSAQILATAAAGDSGTGNTPDPNHPRTATGNIDIHGDWHPGVADATANEGTMIVLRGEITPGVGGLTRVFGNADDDQIVFDQTLLGGQTRAFGSATASPYQGFAPAGDGEDSLTVYLLQTMPTGSTLTLDGQAGTDHYVVWTHGSENGDAHYVINVLDSGAPADGVDTLAVHGADSPLNGIDPATGLAYPTDDIFLLRAVTAIPGESSARPGVYGDYAPAYVAVLHPQGGLPGEDPLAVTETSGYAGVVERVNYDRGLNGMLTVLGDGGNDHFAVDDNAATTTLDGGAGDDSFQIGQIFGMRRDQAYSGLNPVDYFPTIATTRGYLSEGNSAPLIAQGGSGNDTFTVYSDHAALRLEGDDGNDLFTIQAFALARTDATGTLIMGPLFTGAVMIDAATSTITRTAGGSFLDDGFAVGQTLVVQGAGSADDNTASTAYVIAAVTATTITLDRTLSTVAPLPQGGAATVSLSSGPLTRSGLAISTATGTSTIARTDGGSFLTDGYLIGQTIALAGTGTADDNLAGLPYVITGVTATTLTVSSTLLGGTFADATISQVLPSPQLTAGFSTAAQTDVRTGGGDNQVLYNIDAPVSVDGGSGFNKMVVLGTEFADHIVVTAKVIYGAGLQTTFTNIQLVEVDALQGDDTIDVLSTAPGVVTRVLGGLGSDTINVAGDVVGDVVSRDVNGSHSTINQLVGSTDPAYDDITSAGVNVSVARPDQGAVLIAETGGFTDVRRQSDNSPIGTLDSYTVSLAAAPTSDVWITVSAALSPAQTRPGADTVYLCTGDAAACASPADYFRTVYVDGIPQFEGLGGPGVANRAVVLHFTPQNYRTPQTVWVAAANDTTAQGDIVVAIAHSIVSADRTYATAVVRDVEVTVHDNLTPGVVLIPLDGAGNPDNDTTVIKGTATTELTDTFTMALPSTPAGTVTYVITPTDARLILTSTDGRFTLGAVIGGVQTYDVAFTAGNWNDPVLVTVAAVDDFLREDPGYTTLQVTVDATIPGRDATYDAVSAHTDVLVLDDNTPGIYDQQSGGSTVVSLPEGATPGQSDSYTVRLTSAPTAAVTVGLVGDGQVSITTDPACGTSTLGRVCLTAVGTLTASAMFTGNLKFAGHTITRSTGSELGSFLDTGFAAGQLLLVAGAGADSNTLGTAYTITAVTATTITVSTALATGSVTGATLSRVTPSGLFTGAATVAGGVLTRSDGGSWLTSGFVEGQLVQISGQYYKIESIFGGNDSSMSFTSAATPADATGTLTVTQYAPTITFDQSNWWIPVTVTVSADPDFTLSAGRADLMTFPKQPHLLSAIRGPLEVDGGTGGETHTLGNAVILPGELNTPPFGIGQQPSEARQIDVLNIYDDGSLADQHGDLTSTTLTGLGMGPSVTFPGPTSWGEPSTVPGGISYGTITVDAAGDVITDASKTTIEVLNIMLGQGNDTLTIHSTMIPGPDQAADDKLPVGIPSLYGGLTMVQGGGNSLLQVTGTFDFAAGSVTRDDGHSWSEAGFAVGQRVSLPGVGTLGGYTITGFGGSNGQIMLLSATPA
ncbi:beta strand repeat-containing protein, partial [Glutamicibacter protophormiae]|uniref:beta strand repeat-containing protein n=1 Tax=Glutamicibacter protophormiae TaxID=37930 RepID=UPI003A956E15